MPNYIRWKNPGATYFFTVVTDRRRPLFTDEFCRRTLAAAMAEARRQLPFDMFACVLLPEHLHCIWTLPENDADFSARWSTIKRLFTRRFVAAGGRGLPVTANRTAHRERGVWQPRFWERNIRDDDELLAYRDYIHLNPVKHGHVREPTEWPWSSVHRHLQLGWLVPDWSGNARVNVLDIPEPH